MIRILGFFGVVLMLLTGTLVYARRDKPEQWIAFISDRDGNAEIYRMRPDGRDVQQLTYTPNEIVHCWIRWSANSLWLYFGSDDSGPQRGGFVCNYAHGLPKHFRMNRDGRSVGLITQDYIMSQSPDGKWFVVNVDGILFRSRPNGKDALYLGDVGVNDPSITWSPSGEWLAFFSQGGIHLVRTKGGQERVIDASELGIDSLGSLSFSSSGTDLYLYAFALENTGFYHFDINQLELKALRKDFPCAGHIISFSPNGKWLLCPASIAPNIMNMDTHEIYDFFAPDMPYENNYSLMGAYSWSPDSKWLVFPKFDEAGRSKIWRIHPDGTGLEQLTFGAGEDLRPAWSPVMDKAWDGWGLFDMGAVMVGVGYGRRVLKGVNQKYKVSTLL